LCVCVCVCVCVRVYVRACVFSCRQRRVTLELAAYDCRPCPAAYGYCTHGFVGDLDSGVQIRGDLPRTYCATNNNKGQRLQQTNNNKGQQLQQTNNNKGQQSPRAEWRGTRIASVVTAREENRARNSRSRGSLRYPRCWMQDARYMIY